MCGIVGCLAHNPSSVQTVMQGLNKLQNRGYDSAGICTVHQNEYLIKKYICMDNELAVQKLNDDEITQIRSNIAIGHTRWATHGAKIIENAHPHYDDEMRFMVVHNGIIENYLVLKEELLREGYTFYGQTDTEIIAKYLDYLHKNHKDYQLLNTLMEGSWAILILDKLYPNKIYFLKNGSPLIMGFNKDQSKVMFVSEFSGFDSEIEYYYILADSEYGYVQLSECNQKSTIKIHTQQEYLPRAVQILSSQSTPDPYSHWTIKEINDQPQALNNLLGERINPICNNNLYFPELDKIRNELFYVDHLIFLGCGTSYHAAQFGAKYFKEFRTNATIEIIDGADFEESDIPLNRKSLLILLSQSGETKDLYRALVIGKNHSIRSIGIINVENSLIAREVDVCLYLKAGREHAVASTKAFTSQVVMLLLLALWMNPRLEKSIQQKYLHALEELPNDFMRMIQQAEQITPQILSIFSHKTDCFILGKQQCEWIAKEGSLKIKEITYIHSEGYSAAALKHGPFSLLSKDMPVILIANNDRFYTKVENVTSEVKSRLAKVIYLTNKESVIQNANSSEIDCLFYFKTDSIMFPLISVVPFQVWAYYLALARGNQPDYPRNLAKVVTVE